MIHRNCFLRTENAIDPGTMDQYGMSGLFAKLVKAVAKPFTKVFKPKTLLGKIADPFGLMSRNIKFTGRVADVVGTAATLAVGAYAVGAAAGGTAGGFWATAGSGAKIAAAKLGSGLVTAGKGVAAVAAGAAKAMGPAAAAMLAGGSGARAGQAAPGSSPMFTESAAFMGSEDLSPIGSRGPMEIPNPITMDESAGVPGAVVPVEDVAPDGPNWLLIGGVTLAAAILIMRKKGR